MEHVLALLVAVPLVICLSGPPVLQGSHARQACEQLDPDRPAEAVATVRWQVDPFPHWVCHIDEQEPADLGWWVR
ncbi:hypothetical protein CLV46_1541 [Diaminobutyricimonas aerilata]|uniref:Uncharacterized protein n=1 Tax=Diaminobutyricimonas aerilata TaxID=1162967 RepID=A0A2M9CJ99_9MICO|nr:hypothetical protein [Diaminobutyricimonas aerilata]PJJ71981.1 hypothetical protein CLV46_1541 [Diaminobutyricimonas aerilata]